MKIQNAKEIRSLISSHPVELRRIFSIIAHIDHGKSTVADYLLKRAGLISRQRSQDLGPAISMTEEEKDRSITMYTSVVTLMFEYQEEEYLFQFNDTPGHISFTGEVSRALRSSDGVVLVVDALEGVMPQTITNMELAIRDERSKPVLFINKVDRLISELQLNSDEIGKKLAAIVREVNDRINSYVKDLDVNWSLDYRKGSVAIGSAKDGWAFTLSQLDRLDLTVNQVFQKYRTDEKEWLENYLPLDDVLLQMVIEHCPDPRTAQSLKIPQIWSGDTTSVIGQALMNCDPTGPTIGMVTKLVVGDHSNQIILVGRLFSGRLRSSDSILLPSQEREYRVRRLGIMEVTDILNVDLIPAGSLFAMTGPIAQAGETIVKPGLDLIEFEKIRYVAEPVISLAISAKDVSDRVKLYDLVSTWLKVDPTLSMTRDDKNNRLVINGVDPLQLEVLMSRISEKIPLDVSSPTILHRETIGSASGSLTTKSNNRHNRITVQLHRLPDDVIELLKSGQIGRFMSPKEVVNKLAASTEVFDHKFFRGYWAHKGLNLLIESTKGVQRIDRIKDYVIQAWSDFIGHGTLAGEPVHGTILEIVDATVHVDPAHSGVTEIVSMVSAACNLSFLRADPVILEPLMKVEIKAPPSSIGQLETLLRNRRGKIRDLTVAEDLAILDATIPTTQLNGLADAIRDVTSGAALFGYEFDQFKRVPQHLLEDRITEIRLRNKLSEDKPDGSSWKKLIYQD